MRLIFVEGLPGSGKTTTTRWIADTLRDSGILARPYLERDDPHPLHAFWTWGDGYRTDERVAEPFEAGKFSGRILERLKSFVGTLQASNEVLVVEAYPFQSPVRNHLRMGASRTEIECFYREFQLALGSVETLLIYLDIESIEARFQEIVREREMGFRDLLIGSVVKAPYGRSRSLAGWAGMLEFYRDYHALVQDLLAQWQARLLKVSPQRESWLGARDRIVATVGDFLGGCDRVRLVLDPRSPGQPVPPHAQSLEKRAGEPDTR